MGAEYLPAFMDKVWKSSISYKDLRCCDTNPDRNDSYSAKCFASRDKLNTKSHFLYVSILF